MRMLFTSNPLFGHFMPLLPLVDAATQAGHEVVVATGPDLAEEVRRRGLTLWQVGPSAAETFARHAALPDMSGASQLERLRRDASSFFGWPGCQRARALAPLVADWVPEIVVHDIADYAGWETAAATGVLGVGHGFGPHLPHTGELIAAICDGAVEELGTPNRLDAVLSSWYIDPWPVALRSGEPSPWNKVLPLRPEPERADAGERLPAAIAALADRPIVYVTLGTVFGSAELLKTVIAALRELPVNVVATTGPTVSPESLGRVPDNVLVVDFVPQNAVLAVSAAMVSHAGSGTVLGALAAGLPQVCLSLGADQHLNAELISRHCAGISLPADGRDATAIRAAVEQVLGDPSYAAQAAGLQAQIDQMPPAGDVLAHLERLAATDPPIR